jgi:general secretion pathway protein K
MAQMAPQAEDERRPVPAQNLDDWRRAGVPALLIDAMRAHLTVLPQRTPINVNTAPAEVLAAVMDNAALADAAQWVRERNLKPYSSVQDWQQRHPQARPLLARAIATQSNFFEVTGRLRIGAHSVIETSLLQRQRLQVNVVWRQRRNATRTVVFGSDAQSDE